MCVYIGKSSGKIIKQVGWHNDERWSDLIITCSFVDITGRVSDYERKVVQQLCEKQHVAWK